MNFMNQWLIVVVIQSTTLLTAFIIWLRLGNASPHDRHSICTIALTACMGLPLGALVVPATLASRWVQPEHRSMASIMPEARFAQESNLAAMQGVAELVQADIAPLSRATPDRYQTSITWEQAILGIWALGFLAVVITRCAQYVRITILVRLAKPVQPSVELLSHLQATFHQPVTPRLLTVEAPIVPFVVGFVKPCIVLPTAVLNNPWQLKQIVTHEYAHIKRRDLWNLLWQQIVSAVFWWQPLLRSVNRELAAARENIADDYVVSHCDPVSYAETILHLAESVSTAKRGSLSFLSQPPTLEERVRKILTANRSIVTQRPWSTRTGALLLSLVVLLLCGGLALEQKLSAQEPANTSAVNTSAVNTSAVNTSAVNTSAVNIEQEPAKADSQSQPRNNDDDEFLFGQYIQDDRPRTVSGRVLSPSGQPISDCLLLTEVYSENVQTIQTRTNQQGEFTLTLPGDVRGFEFYLTWVYSPGYALRVVAFGHRLMHVHHWDNAIITLLPAETMEVHVRDPRGKPLANIDVELAGYQMPNGSFSADSPEGLSGDPPNEIVQLVRGRTNADGYVQLKSFSSKLMGQLRATSSQYGTQIFDSPSKRDWKINFSPAGSLRIKLLGADASIVKGSSLRFATECSQKDQPFSNTRGLAQIVFDGRDEYLIEALAAGQMQIYSWSWPAAKELLPIIPSGLEVTEGSETKVEIELRPSIEVKGRVVLEDSLKPAKGIRLTIQGPAFSDNATTDPLGQFSLHTLPGSTHIYAIAPSPETGRHYRLPPRTQLVVGPGSPVSIADLVMAKIPELTIHVADASGAPMKNAGIILAAKLGDRIHVFDKQKTGDDGSLTTFLDMAENEKTLGMRGPESGFRFYLLNDYQKDNPPASMPLKEIRRTANELWLQSK